MATTYDVPADKLIKETAQDLKENIKLARPEWAQFVKTGASRERMPSDPDWWWVRSASVLRRIYLDGPVGVQRLRTFYGGRKNRGRKPEEFRRASGKVIRTVLKELDSAGLTEAGKGGRKITSKGRSYLDKLASKVAGKK
ncbi:MAG: 30S ribosomal protein S19e [Candidatus Altiarchaeota archaeon]